MKNGLVFCLFVSFTLATSVTKIFAQTPQLAPLTTFGVNGNGSILPGERSYLTSASTLQRGMAFNPVTGHLLIASRNPTSAPTVNIIDSNTGEDLGALPFTELVSAGNTGFLLDKIGVANDGAIYVGNLTTASTPIIGFVLYRYANETSEQTFVFAGDPSNGAAISDDPNGRWGDSMVVRGAGMDTQILLCSQGNLLAILRPTDESMTAFTATTLTADANLSPDNLSFGEGDTFWSKAGGQTLRRLSFDLNAGTATTLQEYFSTQFPTRIGPIREIISSNLFAGIEVVPGADFVKLYDISDITAPVLLDRETYATNVDNGIYGGDVCYADGRLYTLDSDNGIQAFSLIVSNESLAPVFIANPSDAFRAIGSNVLFTSAAEGIPAPTYQWFFNETNLISGATNSSLTLSNLQAVNEGFYSVIASNSAGSATSAIAALIVTADADLYLYEPFDYPVGAHITDFALGPGRNWTTNGTTANDTIIAPSNLSVTGLATPIGNSITNGGVGAAARLPIGASQNTGEIYASFAMKIDQLGAFGTGAGLIASFVDNGANNQQCRLLATRDGSGFKLGVTKVTTAAGIYDSTVFAEGEQIFVVLRYTFVADETTNDLADLWINPDPASFGGESAPTPTVSAAITGNDTGLIDMWAFRQNTSGNTPATINYDELRIGKTWAAVTPAPGTTTSIRLSFVQNGNGDIVISWPTDGSQNFNLESAAELGNAIWNPVAEQIVVDGPNNTVTISPTAAQRFFRLKQ